jgi:selenocysteine-specific elongation factor
MVLDPRAPKTGKGHAYRLAYMAAMEQDSAEQALAMLLQDADQTAGKAVDLSAFRQSWNLRDDEYESLLASLPIKRFETDGVEFALPLKAWRLLGETLVQAVGTWQRDNPLQQGVKATALQQLMKASASRALFRTALSEALRNGKLSLVGGLVHTVGHKPMVSAAQQESWNKVEAALLERGVQLPLVSELMSATGMRKEALQSALFAASKNGLVYKLNDKRYGLPIHLQQHAAMVAELADSEAGITVIGFRDRLNAGRKLAIEILEHFDEVRFTQRRGESRVIINAGLPAERFRQ